MQIDYNLPELRQQISPLVITIGNFDGVHAGHQAILKHVTDLAKQRHTQSAVITFSNYPSTVLRPGHPVQLICTTEHKVHLLELDHIDRLFLLKFTREFSDQSAEHFLTELQRVLPISTLVLGSDAHIGKNREGNRTSIEALAAKLGIAVEYFPDHLQDGVRISSSRIRELIRQGDLIGVQKLLGRPYSIYANVMRGSGRGTSIGFPTANVAVENLCLPPLGVYTVTIDYQGRMLPGIANLGVAPTVRNDRSPVLEVHLFDQNIDLYGQYVDIRLQSYLRPEKRFDNLADLKLQIARDILTARQLLTTKR